MGISTATDLDARLRSIRGRSAGEDAFVAEIKASIFSLALFGFAVVSAVLNIQKNAAPCVG